MFPFQISPYPNYKGKTHIVLLFFFSPSNLLEKKTKKARKKENILKHNKEG